MRRQRHSINDFIYFFGKVDQTAIKSRQIGALKNPESYATQTAQTRPKQPGAGSHPNKQGQRVLQPYRNHGNNPQAHTQNYIPGVSLGFIVLIILFVTKFLSLVTDAYKIKFYISSIHKDSRAMVYSTLLNLRHDPLVLQRQHTTMFLQERSRL